MYVLLNDEGQPELWPYDLARLPKDRPDIELPEELTDEFLAKLNIHPLARGEAPEGSFVRRVTAIAPVFESGVWSQAWKVEEAPLDQARELMLASLANVRWQHETGGITAGQMAVRTDRDTQGILSTLYFKAQLDSTVSVDWKADQGKFVTVDAASIIAVGEAVFAHVQACFAKEAELTAAILAAKDGDALARIDIHSGWPK